MHEEAIQDMQVAPDETHVITASLDKTAKLIDIESFEVRHVCRRNTGLSHVCT